MKNRKRKGQCAWQKMLLLMVLLVGLLVSGCGQRHGEENEGDHVTSENVVITETGEVIENPVPQSTAPTKETPTPEHEEQEEPTAVKEQPVPTPAIDIDIPVQEQVITDEDQTEPRGNELQIVFLGDSIFDNSRDGTGVPFLTAEKCNADFYNLAIGGTCASIEQTEEWALDRWTSTSLCGVVNAMLKRISTDIFAGTRAGELLSNPNIDFSKTDYFVVEYGTNDFFRGVRQNDEDDIFNMKTYSGALRYAVTNLRDVAPDATIILCSPMYAQFYKDGFMVGDGNSTNNGNGTLADYVGTCNYIAKDEDTLFLNAYQNLGIDGYTAEEYLEDGVHLTLKGRHLYADVLAEMILKYEETKNN